MDVSFRLLGIVNICMHMYGIVIGTAIERAIMTVDI